MSMGRREQWCALEGASWLVDAHKQVGPPWGRASALLPSAPCCLPKPWAVSSGDLSPPVCSFFNSCARPPCAPGLPGSLLGDKQGGRRS